MALPTHLVPFLPGDDTEVILTVTYISKYPRGADGTCAFCHGDPCAETSPPTSLIAEYFTRRMYPGQPPPETCPCCQGRPT